MMETRERAFCAPNGHIPGLKRAVVWQASSTTPLFFLGYNGVGFILPTHLNAC